MKINPLKSFNKFEFTLWSVSCFLLIILFFCNSQRDTLTLIASLTGVTALIFIARGNVSGQILTIVFSLLYGIISFKFRYYGEMITYLGMTAPIALFSVVSWLKNPYEKGKNEVKIASISLVKFTVLSAVSLIVIIIFYYLLRYFSTANLIISTISITTSFLASSLMFLRSPFYAIAYACNDIVLITLWIMASIENISYLPMVLCFVIFFVNDIYGFISWQKMKERQRC
ncbi:MAG: nicotinamide riboside transporter PnuC [Porcipelethomonas sp.]